jgi:hypothetical protein
VGIAASSEGIQNDKQEPEYQTLLRNMLVFEYRNDDEGPWFDINPVLAEAKELKP